MRQFPCFQFYIILGCGSCLYRQLPVFCPFMERELFPLNAILLPKVVLSIVRHICCIDMLEKCVVEIVDKNNGCFVRD